MISKVWRHLVPVVALTAFTAVPSLAQNAAGGVGVSFETYTFAEPAGAGGVEKVTLMSVPFGAGARITSWARIDVAGAWASGKLTNEGGTESTIDGLTDTSIQLSLPLMQDRFTLAVAAILPTGKSELTLDEVSAAGFFASDLFPFSISNWGAGGGLDVSGAVAAPLGGVNVGLRLGYTVSNEYEPIVNEFQYRPGNQLYGRVAADGNVGNGGRLAAEVSFYQFGEDEVDSQNLFQSGNRLQAIVSYSFVAGQRGGGALYAGLLQREHGAFLDASGLAVDETPSQTLLLFGAGLRRPMGGLTLVPAADIRLLSKSDGLAQGYIAGAGVTLEVPMGGATLLPRAKLRFGNLTQDDTNETSVSGFEFGAGIRFGSIRN